MMIDRRSKVPLYYQLYELLKTRILEGEWAPGSILPGENELIDTYQVSRNTVRQALDMLVNEGLIDRHRGKGTFVCHPPITQGLNRIISFTEDMQQRGLEPHTTILFSGIVAAPTNIAETLQVKPGTELAYLERLRLADSEPMSIEHSYLVQSYCPGVLELDYAKLPLRHVLRDRYGINLVYAQQTIRAITAQGEVASKLMVEQGAPLLYIERVSYSDQNIPIEFLRLYHRGDRYTLSNELRDEPI